MKKVARIFEEADGYHICDDALPHLDARGPGRATKSEAMAGAFFLGYSHAVGSGVEGDGEIEVTDPGAPPY